MPTLDFKGKQFIYAHHHTVPFRELVVDGDKSLSSCPGLDDNLIIHGDNLHGLKALLPRYTGMIKCIYIDPPYNTGNEGWCYNDNVNNPLVRTWLEREANTVDNEDMLRHDKWLCMMFPRLRLLHELLRDDGVIFISIDDNEVHHLRMICDEIWGEDNFVGQITIQGNPSGRDYGGIARMHDYVLVYSKSNELELYNLVDINKKLPFVDDISDFEIRELRNRNIAFHQGNRPNLYYPFYLNPGNVDKNGFYEISLEPEPDFIEVLPKVSQGLKTVWRWGKAKAAENININIVGKSMKDGGYQIVEKYREKSKMVRSIWYDKDVNTQRGTLLVKSLFDNKKIFDFPKPVGMLERIIEMASKDNDIVLDSFAGSATTAQAVLDLNKQDGGNRKFILIECEDYADTITAERVRRVIKGVPTANDERLQQGTGGSFTFAKLGQAFDIGKILSGENLPEYSALANYVFYTATGQSLHVQAHISNSHFVGETDSYLVYLIYKPDLAFLRGNESALNEEKFNLIIEHSTGDGKHKQKLVFATAKYMSQKDLTKHKITYCQLPYDIHRIVG